MQLHHFLFNFWLNLNPTCMQLHPHSHLLLLISPVHLKFIFLLSGNTLHSSSKWSWLWYSRKSRCGHEARCNAELSTVSRSGLRETCVPDYLVATWECWTGCCCCCVYKEPRCQPGVTVSFFQLVHNGLIYFLMQRDSNHANTAYLHLSLSLFLSPW